MFFLDTDQLISLAGSVSAKSSSGGSNNSASFAMARTDSSDSDNEEVGKESPLLTRKFMSKNKCRHNSSSEKTVGETTPDPNEELAYVDTLPEEVKLVEVNSNIWGTKFKIHGIAKNLPANLGHISYKTSLLHLQPRQMTVVVTELRDDILNDPDPNFNPHIFSEDEDDSIVIAGTNNNDKNYQQDINAITSIAPMSPIKMRSRNSKSIQNNGSGSSATIPKSNMLGPLAKAESYEDELPVCDKTSDIQKSIRPKNIESPGRSGPSYSSLMSQYSRSSSNSSGQSRHAISPLCCEGSVPTLQSPKNAVAPSDIIFDRPPANGGHTSLMSFSGNTDCSGNIMQVKSSHSCSSEVAVGNKTTAQAALQKRRDLQFIDEDNVTQVTIEPRTMTRTPTVISISPASITRSCSVGYLDSVDIIPSDITLSILRKETPYKRLVLVDRKPNARKDRRGNKKRLVQCGKSKSLDSCDILQIFAKVEKNDVIMPKVHETSETDDSLSDIVADCDSGDEAHLISSTHLAPSMKRFGQSKQHSKNICFKCRLFIKECSCNAVKKEASNSFKSLLGHTSSSGSGQSRNETKKLSKPNHKHKSEIITSYADSPIFTRKHRFGDNGYDGNTGSKKTDYSFSFLKQLSESRRRKRDESIQQSKAEREVHQQIEVGEDRSSNISLHTQVIQQQKLFNYTSIFFNFSYRH